MSCTGACLRPHCPRRRSKPAIPDPQLPSFRPEWKTHFLRLFRPGLFFFINYFTNALRYKLTIVNLYRSRGNMEIGSVKTKTRHYGRILIIYKLYASVVGHGLYHEARNQASASDGYLFRAEVVQGHSPYTTNSRSTATSSGFAILLRSKMLSNFS